MFRLSDYQKERLVRWFTRLLRYNPKINPIVEKQRPIYVIRVQHKIPSKIIEEAALLKTIAASEIAKELIKTHMITIGIEKRMPRYFQDQDEYVLRARLDVVAPIKN